MKMDQIGILCTCMNKNLIIAYTQHFFDNRKLLDSVMSTNKYFCLLAVYFAAWNFYFPINSIGLCFVPFSMYGRLSNRRTKRNWLYINVRVALFFSNKASQKKHSSSAHSPIITYISSSLSLADCWTILLSIILP